MLKNYAAPLHRDDDVGGGSVEAIQVLNVVVGRYSWPLDDESVRSELAIGPRREFAFVPCRLAEQDETGTTRMRLSHGPARSAASHICRCGAL
jgi:hypothetical protein